MKQKTYSGVVVPLVTPLTPNLRLDEDAMQRMMQHLQASDAIPFILGTTGEAASLPMPLKRKYIQLAGEAKQEGQQLYVGISSNVALESVELAEEAFVGGADVVVATLPSYYALSTKEMRAYFLSLAETVSGPLMIYNIPATTHQSIPLELIDELSRHPKIVGLKDSERSDERLQESLRLWSGREDFSFLSGWAARSAEALLNGGDGIVPSTGNFVPQIYRDLYHAAKSADQAGAQKYQELSDRFGSVYQEGRTLGQSLWALKVVMNEIGMCQPVVMPPLINGTAEETGAIKQAYAAALQKQ